MDSCIETNATAVYECVILLTDPVLPARLFFGAAAVSLAYSLARESPTLASLYLC